MPGSSRPLSIRVQCNLTWPEKEPRVFFIGQRKVKVLAVVDRWLATDHGYFKVSGDDGGTYILKNDAFSGDWELTLYDSGANADTRLSSM